MPKSIAISRVWLHYKIYPAPLGPYYNWSDSDGPSNKSLIPNIQIIEFAYS